MQILKNESLTLFCNSCRFDELVVAALSPSRFADVSKEFVLLLDLIRHLCPWRIKLVFLLRMSQQYSNGLDNLTRIIRRVEARRQIEKDEIKKERQ